MNTEKTKAKRRTAKEQGSQSRERPRITEERGKKVDPPVALVMVVVVVLVEVVVVW